MSHFTTIKTRMTDLEALKSTLIDCGFEVRASNSVRGWRGQQRDADLVVGSGSPGYDLGFVKDGTTISVVADWFGIRGTTERALMAKIMPRYAYRSTLNTLEQSGFTLASETAEQNGSVRLLLRRMA